MEGSCSSDELSKINLRPLGLSDIDDFMVWATDEKVARFCTWEPYTSKEDGIKFIKEQVLPHPWIRAICQLAPFRCPRIRGMIAVEANSAMFWGPGTGARGLEQGL